MYRNQIRKREKNSLQYLISRLSTSETNIKIGKEIDYSK